MRVHSLSIRLLNRATLLFFYVFLYYTWKLVWVTIHHFIWNNLSQIHSCNLFFNFDWKKRPTRKEQKYGDRDIIWCATCHLTNVVQGLEEVRDIGSNHSYKFLAAGRWPTFELDQVDQQGWHSNHVQDQDDQAQPIPSPPKPRCHRTLERGWSAGSLHLATG